MSLISPRIIAVRKGQVQPSGSWIYVWIDVDTGEVAYVGGTGFDPALRTYLHVESGDAQRGRVRATVPRYDERDFDVLAFELADDVDRSSAKKALIAHLAGDGAASGWRDVTEPIVHAIDAHRQKVDRTRAAQRTSAAVADLGSDTP